VRGRATSKKMILLLGGIMLTPTVFIHEGVVSI
jgi:hypothetical protein